MGFEPILITCPDCQGTRVIWDDAEHCRTCPTCLVLDDKGRYIAGGQLPVASCPECGGAGYVLEKGPDAPCTACESTGVAGGSKVVDFLAARHVETFEKLAPTEKAARSPVLVLPADALRAELATVNAEEK